MDPVSSVRPLPGLRSPLFTAILACVALVGCQEAQDDDDGPWIIGPSPQPEIVEPVYRTLDNTCAIDVDEHAYCWSGGAAPVRVPGGHRWSDVSGGASFACGVTVDGDLYCWGGMPDLPERVESERDWASVSVGSRDTFCAIDVQGAGACRIYRGPQEPFILLEAPGDRTWVTLDPGDNHACGVTEGGEGLCWGQDTFGELGYEGPEFGDTLIAAPGASSWLSLDTNDMMTCGVAASGTLMCWGYNEVEELGAPPMEEGHYLEPVEVVADGATFQEVFLAPYDWWDAADYSCARSTDGVMFCWGGSRGAVPVAFRPLDWVRIEPGVEVPCGLTTDGEILCWRWGSTIVDQEPIPLSPAQVWPGSDFASDPPQEAS